MNDTSKFNTVVSFLWAIADLLNGAFKKSEFQKIILPFTVLRRLDYALEATKAKVLATEHKLKEKGLENRHGQLCRAAGYAFYNTSKFTYESLLHDDANLALNLRQYVMGFSPNVREIFAAFNFDDAIRDLEKVNLLYLLMERFNEKSKVDLRPASMSNHEMGYVFEHMLRKFNEALNENPGEHFTPREIIRLMVDMVLMFDTELASGEGVARTVNDCCCGTGGILSITKEHILQINPQAKVFLYGQELNPFTWGIARSDMLILDPDGKDAENIKKGSTLSEDQLSRMRFDYQFVNPPYGYEWSKDDAAVRDEAARGFDGRFGAGLPRKSDGQMLFLQHFIARMNDPEESQSYIGIIMNGSPLFTGGAGSGESEIRRWIFENDWLEAIVALPQQIFYNTPIATYIWILSNRKPASHKGKVMLVDASGEQFWSGMPKSLGSKRREITDAHKQAILKLVKARKEGPHLKIFDTTDFGYRQIRVLRPLKLRFEVNAESLARLDTQAAFKKLAVSKKKDAAEQKRKEKEGLALQAEIRAALQTLAGKTYTNREKFTAALKAALKKAGLKLKAPVLKAILGGIGQRDDAAEICRDSSGNPEPDTNLNDTENVPLKEKVETYFDREVTPHVPDAWIDLAYRDAKDGKVGKVGYEIPFNRHFYVFQPAPPPERHRCRPEGCHRSNPDPHRGAVAMNEPMQSNRDFSEVLRIIQAGRARAFQAVNTTLIETYWAVGEYLSRKVSQAVWGKGVVKELASWLADQAPEVKGFSAQNLWRMKQFYEVYSSDKLLSALPRVLSWTHYCTLLGQCKTGEERYFYGISCERSGWSTRELETQIRRGAFERTMLADKKLSALPIVLPPDAGGVFKDSYVLDFLNLPARHSEADLQTALLRNLRRFLMELGDGFAFVGEKVRVQVGNQDFELDLLFYHRDLQCLVAFELKVGRFEPEHLGKLSFYLEALDRDRKRPHENPSIGVLLCRTKDDEVVKYALSRHLSPAMVAQYETQMIPRDLLRQKLHEWGELLEASHDSQAGDQ